MQAALTIKKTECSVNFDVGHIVANLFSNGMPLPEALVTIDILALSALTNSNGVAKLSNLASASYNVIATAAEKCY